MADPIRAALEGLVAAERFIGEAAPEYQQARDAARSALAGTRPAMNDRIRAALERLVAAIDELAGNSVGVFKLREIEVATWLELLIGWQRRWLGDAIDEAREALADARLADPADEQLTTHQLLTTDDLRQSWNAQSDQFNGWDELDLDEQLEWAQRQVLQRLAPSNPPAAEEELNEAREEVADWGPDKIADRISKLAQVQAKAGRELSAALCERASQLISASIIPATTPAGQEEISG